MHYKMLGLLLSILTFTVCGKEDNTILNALKVQQHQKEPSQTFWYLQKGTTLKTSIKNWTANTRWQILWHAKYDYPILATVYFKGSFSQAIQSVIYTYHKAAHPIYLDLYPKQWLAVISD